MRLAVDIGIIPCDFGKAPLSVSNVNEEVLDIQRMGTSVLLFGRAGEGALPEYVAIAKLAAFMPGSVGDTLLRLTDIDRLPLPVDRETPSVVGKAIHEMTDREFTEVVERANLYASVLQEFAAPIDFSPPLSAYAAVARQLSERYGGRCSFSGVVVSEGEGAAVPIKPRDLGGELHVNQCLFLHQEPANLFNMIAWTVGPDYEIIVDSAQVRADVLSTISPTGKLALPDNQDWWPDETLLAWHRQKFFDRLK